MNFALLIQYFYCFSDHTLHLGAFFFVALSAGSWYLLVHQPLNQDVLSIHNQNLVLRKRLDSLMKRTQRLSEAPVLCEKIRAELDIQGECFPASKYEALQTVLSHAKSSGLTMLSWNIQEGEQKEMYATCCVLCSFFGSYQNFTDFLAAIEKFSCVSYCLLKKRVTDMSIRLTLCLFFRKNV